MAINTISLSNKIANNPEVLLKALNIEEYKLSRHKVYLPCPVHGGDNPNGCVIHLNSEPVLTWRCYTHHCEESGKNLFKLVQKTLNISYRESLDFCNSLYEGEAPCKPIPQNTVTKVVIPKCIYPSNYFIDRGFSKSTLMRYEVGFCIDKTSKMFGRHICPIYDASGKECIGLTGRTKWDKCPKCTGYHNPKACPGYYVPKWKYSAGCSPDNIMYNYHLAKNYISSKKEVILVEGQSDVWRLYEAGIYNALGLFGGYLTPFRTNYLKKLGVESIILVMDNDSAGQKHSDFLKQDEFVQTIKTTTLIPPKNDIGELSIIETRKLFYGI